VVSSAYVMTFAVSAFDISAGLLMIVSLSEAE
jgi:hypothetical protein